jgi:hypothetical protein
MGVTSAKWVAAQLELLLPVPYFHVVFTLPKPVADIALRNKKTLYGLLMRLSAEVTQTIAKDPKHLGAELGITSVLHTWSQRLEHHPHVHMVIPGGGLDPDGRWKPCRPNFFLPTPVLAALFRRRFLEELDRLRDRGDLRLDGPLAHLQDDAGWTTLTAELRRIGWNVYAKRPFAGPEAVLKYLSGYTHRGPIANHRLVAFDGKTVTFRARGRSGGPDELVRLPLDTFIQRFVFHIGPAGFIRLRSYGFLAHRVRKDRVDQIRDQLGAPPATEPPPPREEQPCPRCAKGRLRPIADVSSDVDGVVLICETATATTGPPHFHPGPWRAA